MPIASKWKTCLGDRPFYRKMAQLMIPLVVQGTITSAVNLLDNLMIGQTGTLQMSAVAIVNQFVFVFYLVIFGSLSGPGIFSTQFVGARQNDGVRSCFRYKCMICAAATVFCCLLLGLGSEWLMRLFINGDNTPDSVDLTISYGKQYLLIMLLGLPVFTLTSIYASTLREYGETRVPMMASLAALAANLVGNYVLIFGHLGFPAMGVAGAAVATVLSRVVEAAIVIAYTHFKAREYPFITGAYASCRVPWKLAKDITRRGFPLLLNEFVWALGLSAVFQTYSMRGLHVVAAINIVYTISNLFKCAFYSIGGVTSVMVGHELGQNHFREARVTTERLLFSGVWISTAIAIISICLARPLALCYRVEPDIHQMATILLYIAASTAPFEAIVHVGYFAVRAGGQGFCAFLMDGVFLWAVQVLVCWVIAYHTQMHIYGFFALSNATLALKTIICLWILSKNFWVRNLVK